MESITNSIDNSRRDFFIKGDISGIQDFIFNVKSEKAARVLKARSMFVQLFSEFSSRYLQEQFDGVKVEEFSNNGGSFFLYVDQVEKSLLELTLYLKDLEKIINRMVQKESLYLVLSTVEYGNRNDFQQYWQAVGNQSARDKLRKSFEDFSAFEPYAMEEDRLDWMSFAHRLPKNTAEVVSTRGQALNVFHHGIGVLSGRLQLRRNPGVDYFDQKIHNVLPEWRSPLFLTYEKEIEDYNRWKEDEVKKGHIIDFHFLARFAQQRTGTAKLAVLKMDADNFGFLFSGLPDASSSIEASTIIYNFFRKKINSLLSDNIDYTPYFEDGGDPKNHPSTYRDNVYTVFSGGDDCFFIGSWDAILDWAIHVREAFDQVSEDLVELLQKYVENKEEGKAIRRPTLSAGVILVDSTYPIIRTADLAEEAIKSAKNFRFYDQKEAQKDKISVFGQVLSWGEFREARKHAITLKDNMEEDTRSLVERIKRSAIGFEKLQEKALKGHVAGPQVAKLFYFVRNKKQAKALSDDIIKPYAMDLMKAFVDKEPTNPLKYAVAARWAELLTRKS